VKRQGGAIAKGKKGLHINGLHCVKCQLYKSHRKLFVALPPTNVILHPHCPPVSFENLHLDTKNTDNWVME
jgi:hypothetical protein